MNLSLACREIDGYCGLARTTRDLAVALAERGHSIWLLTDGANTAPLDLPNVAIRRLPVPPGRGPFAGAQTETARHNLMHAAAVYREVKRIHEHEQQVDAVLAPIWRCEGAVCLLDGRFPTVISCMTSLQTLTEIERGYRQLPDIGERLSLERAVLTHSPYLHGLTDAVLRKTIADYHLSPDATVVVGRGLRDRNGFAAPQARHRREPTVLFVGRVERRKGVDTLLAAARQLLADGMATNFIVAGPDGDLWLGDSLQREAEQDPHLRSAVRFTGAVSDQQLLRLYTDCDIICVPSRYESHGVVLIEAMMFGKPIVTCDAGGIAEVVQGGQNALVSPPDEPSALAASLRQMIADAELRANLGAAARESYERRFQVQTAAEGMEAFLEQVIARHRDRVDSPVAEGTATVKQGLERLLHDALELSPSDAAPIAGELLDPSPEAWLAWSRELEESDELVRLRQAVAVQERTLAFLHMRHEKLRRVEQGGWWRLRGRLLPVFRLVAWLRARLGRRHAQTG